MIIFRVIQSLKMVKKKAFEFLNSIIFILLIDFFKTVVLYITNFMLNVLINYILNIFNENNNYL